VWAGANVNDPVPNLPPADPAGWLNNYSSHFGTDPTSPQFGGNDFASSYDPGTPSGFDPLYYATVKAHSSYWDSNSSSLLNLAHVVDGQYTKVTLVVPRCRIQRQGCPRCRPRPPMPVRPHRSRARSHHRCEQAGDDDGLDPRTSHRSRPPGTARAAQDYPGCARPRPACSIRSMGPPSCWRAVSRSRA
jgi:hypothetical protein